jgi:hypothetical protein
VACPSTRTAKNKEARRRVPVLPDLADLMENHRNAKVLRNEHTTVTRISDQTIQKPKLWIDKPWLSYVRRVGLGSSLGSFLIAL